MANTGTLKISMSGLWGEEAFWGFFSPDRHMRWKKDEILSKLAREHSVRVPIETHHFVKNLREHIPEERMRELYKEDFLAGSCQYPRIECIFHDNEPDRVTTIARYTYDDRLATALGEIFPEREISCEWFVDGLGDYGTFKLLRHEVEGKTEGNLNEDLSYGGGFYCVRMQRDPDRNPGNRPCPDTDKCHLCGSYQKGEQA